MTNFNKIEVAYWAIRELSYDELRQLLCMISSEWQDLYYECAPRWSEGKVAEWVDRNKKRMGEKIPP